MSSNSILNIKKDGEWVEIPCLKGEDGFSPTATVEKVGKVATITITDINGTTTATIADGVGSGGSGEENVIDSISVNGVDITPDENKNVDITVPTVTNDLTDELKSSYDDAVTAKHTHDNKTVLDGITAEKVEAWNKAEENVQSDWNETDDTADGFIKNKPIIPSLSGYATETWVNEQGFLTQHQDLSNYATKDEIPNLDGYAKTSEIPTKVSELENDSNYLSSIPEEYVTEIELNAKGYLTEHQDISNLVEKEDGKTLISTKDISQIAQNKTDIETLNGTGEGSIEKKIADKLSEQTYLTKEIATADEVAAYTADPTTAKFNVIYLVKDENATGADKYFEYQRLGTEESSEFILTGDTSTDLSDYVKKEKLVSKSVGNIIIQKNDGLYAENSFIELVATNDGSEDVTAKFKKAIADAESTGKNLFIPQGTYLISERLKINKPMIVYGGSRESTIIKFEGVAHSETAYDPDYYEESNACLLINANGVEIRDLTLKGGDTAASANACNGIVMHHVLTHEDTNKTVYEGCERVALTNVEVKGFKNGLFLYGGWNRYITRCYFVNNKECGVKYDTLEESTVGNWSASGDVYIACQMVGNQVAGFYAKGLFETTIWNSVFEYNKTAISTNGCTDICFKNCWNEANEGHIQVIGNCKFEGGYNINNRVVDHTLISSNDLVIFENETLNTMYRKDSTVFVQTAGIITKGVQIGSEVENLITNPGFSKASQGTGSMPSDEGWYHEGDFTIVEDNPNYVTLKQADATTDLYRGLWWNTDIPLNGETKFNVGIWMKTPNRSAIDSSGIMFYIAWKGGSGDTILIDNKPVTIIADNVWEYHEMEITAPSNAAYLKMGWGFTRNGEVSFREPLIATADSLISSNVFIRKDTTNPTVIQFLDINGNKIGSIDLSSEIEAETELIDWNKNNTEDTGK